MIENKRIAITGHTTGIGKGVFDLLNKNNEVLGLCKSNGFDLTNKEKYIEARQIMDNCDIVFNNAYSYEYRFLQTDILNDFLDKSINDESRLIVTMGSMSKYMNNGVTGFNRYASSKILIDDTVNRAKISGHKCGIVVVSPSWVDTAMFQGFKNSSPELAKNITPLSINEIAEQIVMLMELFYEKNINVYSYEVKRMRL